eukprot:Hpha_TRINITY_DN15431_c1_g6::TRINITY_DN15431_c1_g6_i2::g.174131::m.174131
MGSEQVRILKSADVAAHAAEDGGLTVLESVLLEEGARVLLRLLEVRGGHHGPQVVLRLKADVAGEEVHRAAAHNVAGGLGGLLHKRHRGRLLSSQDVLSVVGREHNHTGQETAEPSGEGKELEFVVEHGVHQGVVRAEDGEAADGPDLGEAHDEVHDRLEAPVDVEDEEEGEVVPLLPPLHRRQGLRNARVVAHVHEHRGRADVGVSTVLVSAHVVGVVARLPPELLVALHPAQHVAHKVVLPHLPAGLVVPVRLLRLEHGVVEVVVAHPSCHVAREHEAECAEESHRVVEEKEHPHHPRHHHRERLEQLVLPVRPEQSLLPHLLSEPREVLSDD